MTFLIVQDYVIIYKEHDGSLDVIAKIPVPSVGTDFSWKDTVISILFRAKLQRMVFDSMALMEANILEIKRYAMDLYKEMQAYRDKHLPKGVAEDDITMGAELLKDLLHSREV